MKFLRNRAVELRPGAIARLFAHLKYTTRPYRRLCLLLHALEDCRLNIQLFSLPDAAEIVFICCGSTARCSRIIRFNSQLASSSSMTTASAPAHKAPGHRAKAAAHRHKRARTEHLDNAHDLRHCAGSANVTTSARARLMPAFFRISSLAASPYRTG